MLDVKSHQGKFGEDYVRVLASAAGLIVYTPDLDRDGVDLLLRLPARTGVAAYPSIDVQVKSWSRPRKSGGTWRFDGLNEVQFNKLAGSDYTVPRYLFLVVVPDDSRQYAEISPDGMLLRFQGYYLSLSEEPLIDNPNPDRKHAVHVPIGNVLTVGTLLTLMSPAPSGGGA
ncbi:MAG: DUF4365 domain-containing protein [Trebonia sp.]